MGNPQKDNFHNLIFVLTREHFSDCIQIVKRSLLPGLITVTVGFFVLEFVLQRRVVPHVFPTGGLHVIPGSWRIRIPTRLVALLFACNLVPFIATLSPGR